jgi:hypothetical protein
VKTKKAVASSLKAKKRPRSEPSKPAAKKRTLAELVKYWGVVLRTIQRWISEGAPVDNDIEMVKWLAPKRGLNEETHARIAKIRADNPDSFPRQDPVWLLWLADAERRALTGESSPFESIEQVRDFYAFKLKTASEAGDQRGSEFATARLIEIDKTIRDNKLAEKKLGIESGDTIPRADVEKWLRAFGFWTMRCVDLMLEDMVPKVASLAPTLTHEIARKAIEPGLIKARSLAPFVLATKVTGGTQLPDWAVAVVKDTVDDYVQNGAARFEEFKWTGP